MYTSIVDFNLLIFAWHTCHEKKFVDGFVGNYMWEIAPTILEYHIEKFFSVSIMRVICLYEENYLNFNIKVNYFDFLIAPESNFRLNCIFSTLSKLKFEGKHICPYIPHLFSTRLSNSSSFLILNLRTYSINSSIFSLKI